jgi:glycosyltransferase involved in cell wall biosynthesis
MSYLETHEVQMAEVDARLLGRALDKPKTGDRSDGATLGLMGWVLGRDSRAVAIEIEHDGRIVQRIPLDHRRPDLLLAFPDVADADRGGFRGSLDMLGIGEFEVALHAVLADQQRVPLAILRVQHGWREDTYHAATPLVSVVIPCYAQARYLPDAIESVLAQTYPHLEVVVVDDGSPDNTGEVAGRYPGVRVVAQENTGLAGARNTGLRHTNGAYLVFLDADDRLLPNALADGLASFAAHPEAAMAVGRCRLIDTLGSAQGKEQPHPEPGDPYEGLLRGNYIWMPGCVMYRRVLFEAVGTFDSAVDASADYDMYLRVARQYPIHRHRSLVGEYRQHEGSMSRDPERMLAAVVTTLRRQWPHVRSVPALREAYESGMRMWRSLYGDDFATEVRRRLDRHEWSSSLSGVSRLLRLHPRGLARLR